MPSTKGRGEGKWWGNLVGVVGSKLLNHPEWPTDFVSTRVGQAYMTSYGVGEGEYLYFIGDAMTSCQRLSESQLSDVIYASTDRAI